MGSPRNFPKRPNRELNRPIREVNRAKQGSTRELGSRAGLRYGRDYREASLRGIEPPQPMTPGARLRALTGKMALAYNGPRATCRTAEGMTISLKVNGSQRSVPVEADTPLL